MRVLRAVVAALALCAALGGCAAYPYGYSYSYNYPYGTYGYYGYPYPYGPVYSPSYPGYANPTAQDGGNG